MCADICYVMIYDGIRGNICDVLSTVLQNGCYKEIKEIKTNNFFHYIWKLFVFEIPFQVSVFKYIYIWMCSYLSWWKVFVFKYFTMYMTPYLYYSSVIWVGQWQETKMFKI